MNFLKITAYLFLLFFITSCQQEPAQNTNSEATYPSDPHSFSDPNSAVAKHLDLHLKVDFETKTLAGFARWDIENQGVTEIVFDTRDLVIEKVTLGKDEKETNFNLVAPDELLGQALRVNIEPETEMVTIYYSTKPEAAALGWLDPVQTAGKKLPFLFTQGQAILTRSWIPCQDSPGIRVTYNATIETPTGMMA